MKRPPYASALESRLTNGWRPANGTIFIAAGPNAWRIAKGWAAEPRWRAFFAIPNDCGTYDLRVTAGFDCVVLAHGLPVGARIQIAIALITAGATLALMVADNAVSYRPLRKAA